MSETGLGPLAEALSKAQAAFPKVVKDRTAKIDSSKGGYSYKYADLASLLDAVRKPLADNGLALTQPIIVGEHGMVLHTMLLHVSGAHLDSYYPLAAHERPQEMGSEITYSRRYTAGAILGIASEDDDDGEAAQQGTPAPRIRKPGEMPTNTERPSGEALVTKVDRKSGTNKAGNPWTSFTVTLDDGRSGSTFDTEMAHRAERAMERQGLVKTTWEKSGKYTNLTGLEYADEVPFMAEGPGTDGEVTEAKRISYLAAIKRAADKYKLTTAERLQMGHDFLDSKRGEDADLKRVHALYLVMQDEQSVSDWRAQRSAS